MTATVHIDTGRESKVDTLISRLLGGTRADEATAEK